MVPLRYVLQGLLVAMGRHLVSSVQQVLTAVQVLAFAVYAYLVLTLLSDLRHAQPVPLEDIVDLLQALALRAWLDILVGRVPVLVVLAPLAPGAAHRPQLASPAPLGLTVPWVD